MQTYDAAVQAAEALGTSAHEGLDAKGVEAARRRHGENRLPEAPSKSVWAMFLGALNDKTLFILIGAAALALGVEALQGQLDPSHTPHYLDGVAILVAVLIAAGVTTLNEARAAKQFRLLNQVREDVPVKVLRAGHVRSISIYEVVVGDVVHFDPGDRLPADGVLLSGVDVTVDQSTLTGESVPADKGPDDLELKGGTAISTGSGQLLVQAVGPATEIGKLQLTLTSEEEGETPLQERLAWLADRIGLFGLGAAILTFVALTVSHALNDGALAFDLATAGVLLSFAIVAVTIVVVAVPEGLPLAVTISLAYSVRKMAKENNLVRKLASCETMGAATVVCSDKTGTLTMNRMSVVGGWLAGVEEEGGAFDGASSWAKDRFSDIAAIDATAFLETREDGVVEYVGNATECALLAQVADWGEDWRARRDDATVAHQLGFTSDRKRMSTLVATPDGGGRLLVKGAPEVLLARAGALATQDGGTTPLDDAGRGRFTELVRRYSEKGHRTLALAYRDVPGPPPDEFEGLEEELVLVALVAIADPVRPEVTEAVAACREAGVEVKVVTGDNALTARTIAAQIGLLGSEDVVMEGAEFRAATDEALQAVLPRLRVLARSVPSDKHRLVGLLKAGGAVVAVTGDGTNDAPAMKAADVGFSMGRTGTEVAKEASDIVLLDDNFATIVSAILWGRGIFENIRKFLQFQLTVNVVALSTAFLAALFGLGVPLNTVQLLWVNLIMDTLAALALATEPPDRALFHQPPHGRHAPLITRSMWTSVFAMSGVMLAVLLLVMFTDALTPPDLAHEVRLTLVFNVFVMMQVFNELNARAVRFDRSAWGHLTQSPLFVGVVVSTVLLQVIIVQYGGAFFRTVPLSLDLWGRSVALGALMLVAGAAVRGIGRRLPPAWFSEGAAQASG